MPCLLNIFSSENEIDVKDTEKSFITSLLGSLAKNNIVIFGTITSIVIASILGILRLQVENSFINYFDKETEIYKGMKKIDDDLGGTTPLNVIIKFPAKQEVKENDDEFSEWDEDDENRDDKAKYWFTRDKMDKILKVHDYLDSLPEIGKSFIFWFNFKSR